MTVSANVAVLACGAFFLVTTKAKKLNKTGEGRRGHKQTSKQTAESESSHHNTSSM
jgi:hypothetical protein